MGLIFHESYVNVLSKKNSGLGQMGHLGPKMSHIALQLWICCKDCFTISHNKKGQERHGNYNNRFPEGNLTLRNLVILE